MKTFLKWFHSSTEVWLLTSREGARDAIYSWLVVCGVSQLSLTVDHCTSYCISVIKDKFKVRILHNRVQTCKFRLKWEDNDFRFGNGNGGR